MLDKDSKKKRKKVGSSKSTQKKLTKGKSQSKASKKAKLKKINKNKSNKIKVIALTIAIILSLCIIAASYYLIKTPKFNIASIVVEGNNKTNIDVIISKSQIKLGDNIVKSLFTFNKKDVLEMPYISNVNLSIKFPSELVIKVTEMESIYYAYDKEKNVYYRLDENGIVLELCDKIELKEKEILVNGITFDDEVKLGAKINEIDYSKVLVYEKIEKEFNNIFPEQKITKVNFENSLTKIYVNDKIEVILPNETNLKYNLTFLKDIISNVGDVSGTIDMTKDHPTFITF